MNVTDFVSIGVVGAVLSIAFQYLKSPNFTAMQSKLLVVVLSILVGGAYFLLRDTSWWATILGVLGSASTVYALFLKE